MLFSLSADWGGDKKIEVFPKSVILGRPHYQFQDFSRLSKDYAALTETSEHKTTIAML